MKIKKFFSPDDQVLTPGGYRPASQVNPPGGGVSEPHVLTPGGYRPASQVHLIESGNMLSGDGGRLRLIHPSGGVLSDFGPLPIRPGTAPLHPANVFIPQEKIIPAFGSGWITYVNWNNTGNPVTSFSTTWTVPPPPATQSGQTIFLFNGIQNSSMIYQPVLQWGSSAAGGGNYWSIASWYVDGQGGPAFHSSLIQVSPGQILKGVMTQTGQSGGLFSYNCDFEGIANSGYAITNVQQLTWFIVTMECYGITKCADYPNTSDSSFRDINIRSGSTNPSIAWTPVNVVQDCGQHAVVVNNSSVNGEVDLYYQATAAWNHNDLTTAAGSPPLAASDPIGYTWDVDKTEHVVYRGTDNHIHELWFNGKWNHNDLTVATGNPPLAAGKPAGYTWSIDSTEHVVYRGADDRVHELWFNGTWNHNDLTAAAGNPPSPASDPEGYTWAVDKTEHVVYRGTDNHIHELWFNGSWHHNDLTVATGNPPMAVGKPYGYTWDVDNTEHVIYRGSDNHIHELWFNGTWHHNDLTGATGFPPLSTSDPMGYTWSADKTEHVIYYGIDNHIHELWFNGTWNHNDLTNASGYPDAPVGTDPGAYTWDADNTEHVVYRGTDNHVHELWFNGNWNHNDLTNAAGQPPLPAGDPVGYTWDVDKTEHVVYRGVDNHIHELWL